MDIWTILMRFLGYLCQEILMGLTKNFIDWLLHRIKSCFSSFLYWLREKKTLKKEVQKLSTELKHYKKQVSMALYKKKEAEERAEEKEKHAVSCESETEEIKINLQCSRGENKDLKQKYEVLKEEYESLEYDKCILDGNILDLEETLADKEKIIKEYQSIFFKLANINKLQNEEEDTSDV